MRAVEVRSHEWFKKLKRKNVYFKANMEDWRMITTGTRQ